MKSRSQGRTPADDPYSAANLIPSLGFAKAARVLDILDFVCDFGLFRELLGGDRQFQFMWAVIAIWIV